VQIDEADEWWEIHRTAAPGAIDWALERASRLLLERPYIGAVVRSRRRSAVRRIYLNRVHYHLYYRVEGDTIWVMAFWYAGRSSGPPL
jgi:plasmid stabilization system protein ParE